MLKFSSEAELQFEQRREGGMFDRKKFDQEKLDSISKAKADSKLIQKGLEFVEYSDKHRYGYNWTWMGLPIIQMPEDIVLTQELIWELKPDYVIELGIAWGGSLAMYASFMELSGKGQVIGIDITIPEHNAEAIMSCPVSSRISLIRGSSIDKSLFDNVAARIPKGSKVIMVLDSNHTHEHVYKELILWSPLVHAGSYIIVSDTIVEHIPAQVHRPRHWGPGNNPGTAAIKFLNENSRFTSDNSYSDRAIASFNPAGYLKALLN
jgi:cephalosporin hydroxylase